ncbi:MAG: hypothetical protein WCZ66_12025 [Sphingomonadaceae bacterium]
MASAFDELDPFDAEYIRKRFLAGDAMSDIRAEYRDGDKFTFSLKRMREMRDEVFEPLIFNPDAVKELANGAVLNPLEVVRYRRRTGRKPRMARPGPTQIEMFA